MEWLVSGVIIALLGACLIALILVSIARREAAAIRTQAMEDARELRARAQRQSQDADARQQRLDAQESTLASQRKALRKETQRLRAAQTQTIAQREEVERARQQVDEDLAAVAGTTPQAACDTLAARLTQRAEVQARAAVAAARQRAEQDALTESRRIVTTAAQRVASATSAEVSVTALPLEHGDLRGRIIGKDGRNIRTFESVAGVDLIVDDDSDMVLISCFDARRREIATEALRDLLADGRISPQRIEEALERAGERVEEFAQQAAITAMQQAGVADLSDETIQLLGSLHWRTSLGQNLLAHCVETGQLAGAVAAELGADVALARRVGLLHDIGKGLPPRHSHALDGADFLRAQGESSAVVNAVASHHDEVPATSLEAVILHVADAVSAARPGARREDQAKAIERLARIEQIAQEFPGVTSAVALSAGREVRVAVNPADVSDRNTDDLAQQIATRLADEVAVPGAIQVTVVREVRAVASASATSTAE